MLEAIAARVDPDTCTGCQTCIGLCSYNAISFDEEKQRAQIDETLCRGCGTCVAACPSGAIVGNHFTGDQVAEEIEALLKNGSTQRFIAKRYGSSEANLNNWLKKNKIDRTPGL